MQAGDQQDPPQAGFPAYTAACPPYPPPPYPQQPYGPPPYPQQPYGPPPALARKRSRLRPLWIALAYAVPFALLLGAAAVVTPILFPPPSVSPVSLAGPASADELARALQAPPGMAEGETEVLDVAGEAEAVSTEENAAVRRRLADGGYRWSVRLAWTGTGGAEGWLRLVQFRTDDGAREHHRELLGQKDTELSHGERWSVPDAPRAIVFTYDTFASGNVAHAVFGRSNVTAEASISHAGQDAQEDLMALIYDVSADLPGDPWIENRPAEQPIDIAAFMMSAPDGMRLVRPVRTMGLVDTAEILYAVPEDAENFLISLGHKRSAEAEFRRGTSEALYVMLMRFGNGFSAHTWLHNDSDGLEDFGPYRTGDLPDIGNGAYYVFRTEGAVTHGYAVFRKGDYGVQIYTEGSRLSTSEQLISLAQAQFDSLPETSR